MGSQPADLILPQVAVVWMYLWGFQVFSDAQREYFASCERSGTAALSPVEIRSLE